MGGKMAGTMERGKCAVFHSATTERELADTGGADHPLAIMQAVTDRLKNFLQYVAVNLIEDPSQAQLKVAELGPKRLRFKLILAKGDVAMLIGRNGFTASAIRSVLKAAADREGVQVSLQIHSHEEEAEMMAREEGH
jgi:predicted RNA-binding protein YlqC (UPF0109 family)